MPILSNPKHEAFAQAYAISSDTEESHAKAYGKGRNTRCNLVSGRRLLKIASVATRIVELRSECAPAMKLGLVLSMAEKREFLALVVRTPIGEVTQDSRLCQSWKRIETEHGGSVEYKMPDKLRAIELDAKLAGELVEHHNVTGSIVVTLDQLRERVNAIRDRRLERENAGRN